MKEAEIIKETAENLTKDIFDYFNQEFLFGLVNKNQIATEFNFDSKDLAKLKFKSKKEFLEILNEYKTDLFNRMNFEELKNCLLYNIKENGIKENINLNSNKKEENNNYINKNDFKTQAKDNNLIPENTLNIGTKEENNFFDNNNDRRENIEEMDDSNEVNSNKEEVYEIQDEEDYSDYLPVYNTKNIIIKYDNTEKRLQETNQLLYKLKPPQSSTDDIEEDSLEIKIDLNIDKENPKEITYYDYKKVLNKYSDKDKIDFTIPQPFDFQKDSKSKINAANRLKNLLMIRKEAELN